MGTSTIQTGKRRATGIALAAILLLLTVAVPVSASVQELQNAFNPRGFFVTLKSSDQPEWLRSSFASGYYRSGDGGGGNGTGNGGKEGKDELGHSNITYIDGEVGLDYVDAADVDTIYSTYDHNPTPGKDFMIGYYKDEQAASLKAIPNFTGFIGTPGRGSSSVPDPSGGQWWNVPIRLSLGEKQEDGSRDALEPGTLYEFAYLRGNQANNGTTCVLMPGEEEGTYKGYIHTPFTEEERAIYEAHKYDEYEFITGIEGDSSDKTIDHKVQSVPMRYRIQTFADMTGWTDSKEYQEAEQFLAEVTEADYDSGRYVRENVTVLSETISQLNEEAETSVKYQLQKDAEWTIQQMIEDLKKSLETARAPRPTVDFEDYNTALSGAESTYESLQSQIGTQVGQYLAGPVEALKTEIDHAKSTISGTSSQEQVDTETAALNRARIEALDGLIVPDERQFQDSATGIIVTAPLSALPETAQLAVREVVNSTSEYSGYVSRISPTPDVAVIYRIVFYDGTDVVQPTQPVTVQIPLLDSFEQTAPSVFFLEEAGGEGQAVNAATPAGYRVFSTSQMGTFAVAGQRQNEPEAPAQPSEEPVTPTEKPTSPEEPAPPPEAPAQPSEAPAPSAESPARPREKSTRPPVHSTIRTTTGTISQKTTRILRTTRDPNNDQNQKNEVTSTTVLQTQAVQPTTMMTTTTAPTTAKDTSDLEQDANPNTLLYIALGIAGVGLGTLGYQLVKDGKLKDEEDNDAQL